MARNSYKTFLMNSSDGTTWTKLVDIKEFPDMGQAPDTLETTTLSDPMKTYINDLLDTGGGLEFNLNYTPEDYQTLEAHSGKEEHWALWLGGTEKDGVLTPTGSEGKFSFKGQLTPWLKGAGTSAVVEMGASIAPSTPIEFTYTASAGA